MSTFFHVPDDEQIAWQASLRHATKPPDGGPYEPPRVPHPRSPRPGEHKRLQRNKEEKLRESLTLVQSQRRALEKSHGELNRQVYREHRKSYELEGHLERTHSRWQTAEDRIENLSALCQRSDEALQSECTARQVLQNELDSLRILKAQSDAEYEKAIMELRTQVTAGKKAVGDAQRQVEASKEDLRVLQQRRINDFDNRRDTLAGNTALENELHHCRNQVAVLEAALAEEREVRAALEERLAAEAAQRALLEEALQEQRAQIVALHAVPRTAKAASFYQ